MTAYTVSALLAATLAAAAAAVATRVRLLPEMIDISIIPTCSGVFSIFCVTVGALLRFDHDRIARLSLFGVALGGIVGILVLVYGLWIGLP